MERTDDSDAVPLTHEQLATLLGVGRSYASRIIQTFKAEGVLETRRGWIVVRNREALKLRGERIRDLILDLLRTAAHPVGEDHHLVFALVGHGVDHVDVHIVDARGARDFVERARHPAAPDLGAVHSVM